jgi:hypothetical protein
MMALESEAATRLYDELPALHEAFLEGQEARAHALLDAGVDPPARAVHPRRWRRRDADDPRQADAA